LQELCLEMLCSRVDLLRQAAEQAMYLPPLPTHLSLAIAHQLSRRRALTADVLTLVAGSNSESVSIPDCSFLSESSLSTTLERCGGNDCHTISLGYAGRGLTDSVFRQLPSVAPNLRILSISGAYQLNDDAVSCCLPALSRLSSLSLDSCSLITEGCLVSLSSDGAQGLSLSSLRSLSLRGCSLGEGAATMLLDLLPLHSLDLTDTLPHLDDALVASLANRHTSLTTLSLGAVDTCLDINVGDTALEAIATSCRGLEHLTIRRSPSLTSHGLVSSAANLSQLVSLSLAECHGVDDAGLIAVVSVAKSLAHLNIARLLNVTDATLSAIVSTPCRALRFLDISWCRALSSPAVCDVVAATPLLATVVARGCRIADSLATSVRPGVSVVGAGFSTTFGAKTKLPLC